VLAERVVTVAKSGAQYTTIQGAIDYAYATWGPIADLSNTAVVLVAPGIYEEQIHSYAGIYITSFISGWDTSLLPPPATLYNTGADAAHYPLRTADTDVYHMSGMNIEVDAGGVYGKVGQSQYVSCHFENGHFIDGTEDVAIRARHTGCTFEGDDYGGFYLTGGPHANSMTIEVTDCLMSGVPTFTSTHTGTATITYLRGGVIGNFNFGGDWDINIDGVDTYGTASRNEHATSGDVVYKDGSYVNGLHFTSAPNSFEMTGSSFVGKYANQIPADEGDITSDVVIEQVNYLSNIPNNGIDGEIQINLREKRIGPNIPNTYRNLQEALDSVWEDDSIIILNEDQELTAELNLPQFDVSINAQDVYSINSTATNLFTVTAGETIKLIGIQRVTGGKIIVNGNGAHLEMVRCGRTDENGCNIQILVSGGNSDTHVHIESCRIFGNATSGVPLLISAVGPIIYVRNSFLQGYTGSPAVNFTVEADSQFNTSRTTFVHGDAAGNTPIIRTGAFTVTVAMYQCAGNANLDPAGITNDVGGAQNAEDVAITY
jgi:hypothetical protein